MRWTANDLAAAAAAATAVGALAVWAWRKVLRPPLKFLIRFARDWEGEPARPKDGVPERPGMMRRMANVEALAASTSALVHSQLKPNGGSSLVDKVDRIDAAMPPPAPEIHIHPAKE